MDGFLIIFYEIIVCLILLESIMFLRRKLRKRRVLVVENNKDDIFLYKRNLKLNGCKVDYKTSTKGLIKELLLKKPDAVIIDFHLNGTEKGLQLMEFCDTNKIPALLVTGDEHHILGISEDRIIRKSADQVFIQISNWVCKQVAL